MKARLLAIHPVLRAHDVTVSVQLRQASFERAARSYEATVAAYMEAGYRTCVIPKAPVQERVAFVLARMEAGT